MKKERAAFERILNSKVNVAERETERKLQKQIKEAKMRLQKAEALEQRYSESQLHAKRLIKEIETMKKQKKIQEKKEKMLKYENDKVKGKLDGLWASQEADLEHVRLTTNYEAEKTHQIEV